MTTLGMSQGVARRLARDLGGVATQARLSPSTGRWILGGWANKNTVWIVVSINGQAVLADHVEEPGRYPENA